VNKAGAAMLLAKRSTCRGYRDDEEKIGGGKRKWVGRAEWSDAMGHSQPSKCWALDDAVLVAVGQSQTTNPSRHFPLPIFTNTAGYKKSKQDIVEYHTIAIVATVERQEVFATRRSELELTLGCNTIGVVDCPLFSSERWLVNERASESVDMCQVNG